MTLITKFLHFDSANATYLTSLTNTSNCGANPYIAQYPMNQTYSNVKKVSLKTIELPMGMVNIRTGSTDTLKFTLNGTTYTVVLSEKNYDTISGLLTDLNTACVGIVTNVTITFSVSSSLVLPTRLLITFTGSVATTTFSIVDTSLSKYVLGFRSSSDSLLSSVYKASVSNYNLNYDNYINMYIPTLNSMNNSTFKIPLNSVCNQIYFYQDNSSFNQCVDITDAYLQFTNITVILTDRFGKNINPNGLDWSFSIEITYDL